jgi:hypothetical protein
MQCYTLLMKPTHFHTTSAMNYYRSIWQQASLLHEYTDQLNHTTEDYGTEVCNLCLKKQILTSGIGKYSIYKQW